ncbi:multiple sugar transport system permease protein [Paenibacillus castaneae]|uniref:carbohydrate ABC transporter permease n=1 Tax=Paenibacillus castaneae TaxID=474957 RepID=UPI000C9CCFA1|nr:carbohydrate ABC transporter permease [Paenibacillus castaneae]NIK79592.1 multiple sugar transport system permease protein [Paenibacillus castaneae]
MNSTSGVQQKYSELQGKAEAVWKVTWIKRGRGIVGTLFFYLVILSLAFVFVYPLLYMVSKSLMRPEDVADATIQWIPKQFSLRNYAIAMDEIKFWPGLLNSIIISFGSAILQVVSCSIVGYGFARFRFPGQAFFLALVVFTFLVPPQTFVVPLFKFFLDMGWVNTHLPFIVPALLGHGLKGSLFVLIFIQFYRTLPNVLEEAARIDGAGAFRTYWMIMFPLAKPAMLVVFLFSVVWHWNDLFEPNLYLLVPEYFNLAQNMAFFNGNANLDIQQAASSVSTGTLGMAPTLQNQVMAGVMLTILPILILYMFTQRYFVESVERSGIAGE